MAPHSFLFPLSKSKLYVNSYYELSIPKQLWLSSLCALGNILGKLCQGGDEHIFFSRSRFPLFHTPYYTIVSKWISLYLFRVGRIYRKQEREDSEDKMQIGSRGMNRIQTNGRQEMFGAEHDQIISSKEGDLQNVFLQLWEDCSLLWTSVSCETKGES